MESLIYSELIHRALQIAAHAHRGQNRKGGNIPYISHPAMVALILQKAGFDEETVAAGVLHDVVEDTEVPLAVLAAEFGTRVAKLVEWMSEKKHDDAGVVRSWEARKQDHYESLCDAPVEAKAIALADKLHNLQSLLLDERAGSPDWSRFKVEKERWLWNARRMVEACAGEDDRLQKLAAECRQVLAEL